MKRSFWKNKVVFITGLTGFVGSALARRLLEGGARVIGLVHRDHTLRHFEKSDLKDRVKVVRGSLGDLKLLERTLRSHKVEIVYHLAAQAIVGKANQDPLPTFESNIQGTWNLLEACRRVRERKMGTVLFFLRKNRTVPIFPFAVVVASSDKAYGTHKRLPYREDFPLQPDYPYDVSKACADMIAMSYHKTFGLPVVVTRFANIYGPGDMNFSRIVPDTLRSVLRGKRPVLRSDGTPERDYLYVDDVVDLYRVLAERIGKTKGEVFNAGHNKPVSVLSLVETILRLAGRGDLKPIIKGRKKLHGEIDRQWMDGKKAEKLLGWKPRVDLKTGLRKTISWYAALDGLPARVRLELLKGSLVSPASRTGHLQETRRASLGAAG